MKVKGGETWSGVSLQLILHQLSWILSSCLILVEISAGWVCATTYTPKNPPIVPSSRKPSTSSGMDSVLMDNVLMDNVLMDNVLMDSILMDSILMVSVLMDSVLMDVLMDIILIGIINN